LISGYRHEGDEKYDLLGYKAVTFRDNLSAPSSRFCPLDDETDRLSRNVSEELPLLVA
jgi:hypothetical protein